MSESEDKEDEKPEPQVTEGLSDTAIQEEDQGLVEGGLQHQEIDQPRPRVVTEEYPEASRKEIHGDIWDRWKYETDLITLRYRFFILVNTSLLALFVYTALQPNAIHEVEKIFLGMTIVLFGQLACWQTQRSIQAAIYAQKYLDMACRWLTKNSHRMFIGGKIFRTGWSDVTIIPWCVAAGWPLVAGHLFIHSTVLLAAPINADSAPIPVMAMTVQDFLFHFLTPVLMSLSFTVVPALGLFALHISSSSYDIYKFKKRHSSSSSEYDKDSERFFDMSQEDIRAILFNLRPPHPSVEDSNIGSKNSENIN